MKGTIHMITSNRRKIAALVLPFALIVAACGSDDSSADTSTDTTEATATDDTGTDDAMTDDTAADDMNGNGDMAGSPEGPGCAAVPEDGDGSFDGMAQDPVATAASNNPALETLVAAVTAAELGDTLNTTDDITVFAPVNDAFDALPEGTVETLLEDPTGDLTDILTYHVVGERIEPEDLSGSYETLNGAELTVDGDAPEFDVDGQATVICSGVQTANATVYLIDSVLIPEA
jgi:uncharacterized surface protein with fasciclin (FAS1) repeats